MGKKKQNKKKERKNKLVMPPPAPIPTPAEGAGFHFPGIGYKFSTESALVRVFLYVITLATIIGALWIINGTLLTILSGPALVVGLSKIIEAIKGKDG